MLIKLTVINERGKEYPNDMGCTTAALLLSDKAPTGQRERTQRVTNRYQTIPYDKIRIANSNLTDVNLIYLIIYLK